MPRKPAKSAQLLQRESEIVEAKRAAPNRLKLTVARLNELLRTRPHQQKTIWDGGEHGLCVLVSRGPKHARQGTVTFRVCFYLKGQPGKPQYLKIGRYPDGKYTYPYKDEKGKDIVIDCSNIDDVRDAARNIRTRAKRGIDPRRQLASDVFEDVVKNFIDLHAKKNNRSWRETQRIFDRYVLPEWRFKKMADIDKDHVTALLDKIEQKKIRHTVQIKGKSKVVYLGGPLTASATLAQISKLFSWHASRTKHFDSPIVKGMGRGKPKKRARTLSDTELRVLWPLLDDVYGAILKTALLTAQRFHKVSPMCRADLKAHVLVPGHFKDDGEWVDDTRIDNVWDPGRDDDPENKQVSAVPLSDAARAVIASVPVVDNGHGSDFVFSLNGRKPIKGWSKFKRRLDTRLRAALHAQGLEYRDWQHRDLRRTAKTLMPRAGVSPFMSERCLAHVLRGVEGVYDRYKYLREKRQAFDKLAALVERIVNPPEGNVADLAAARRGRSGATESPSYPPAA